MTDLDAAIRAKLDRQRDTMTLDDMFVSDITGDWQDAILAVLDVHAPGDEEPGLGRVCTACVNPASGHFMFDPCETKRVIAEALGINTESA